MPYDKIIDSAKLDAAVTASADAIRAKTGSTARIPWNESTGFASAISAIESGGGKVATGSFTISSTFGEDVAISSRSFTVSGLDFKPTAVVVYIQLVNENSSTGLYANRGLLILDTVNGIYTAGTTTEDYDADMDEYYDEECIRSFYAMGYINVTFNSDGFKIAAYNSTNENGLYWKSRVPYNYVAIG